MQPRSAPCLWIETNAPASVRHLLREILWQGQPAAKTHIMFQAAARQSGVGILPFPNPGAGLPLPVLILLQKIP